MPSVAACAAPLVPKTTKAASVLYTGLRMIFGLKRPCG
jgi:hypothetical protein